MKVKSEQTDYQKFTAAVEELGGEKVQDLGHLKEMPTVKLEAWRVGKKRTNTGEGFILSWNVSSGRIGIYEFVGEDGGSIEQDLQWLLLKYRQVQDGKK